MSEPIDFPHYFTYELLSRGATTILSVVGHLDAKAAGLVAAELDRQAQAGVLLIHVGRLTALEAEGLTVLSEARERARQRGQHFEIISARPAIVHLLQASTLRESLRLEAASSPPPTLGLRDRLLLAFANLSSYAIIARGPVRGSETHAHLEIAEVVRLTYPYGEGAYVFWLVSDDVLFDPSGSLPATASLPLHYGDVQIVPAITAACAEMSVTIINSGRPHLLGARDATSDQSAQPPSAT